MSRRWLTLTAAMFIATAALASCDPGSPGNVDSPTGPAASVVAPRYELIRAHAQFGVAAFHAADVIGPQGGTVRAGGHAIVVPPGAVVTPTLFTLRAVPDGYVEIEATALVERPGARPLNIGKQGFNRPVTLTLSYAGAANVPADPNTLLILRKLGEYAGPFEALPSQIDRVNQTVSAQLRHFSGYIMAAN